MYKRQVVQIGSNHILTRGASGRVLLAYLPEERIRLLLESDPYTTEQALEAVSYTHLLFVNN